MPIPQEYQNLVAALETGTEDQKLSWTATANEDEFSVSLDDLSIGLRLLSDMDRFRRQAEQRLLFRLLDSAGNDIDRFTVTDSDGSDFHRLMTLHDRARRAANKVGERIRYAQSQIDRLLKSK